MRRFFATLLMSGLTLSSANAALLTGIQGTVLLNQGSGFQPAISSAEVAPGSRVRVENGAAEIVYGTGCVVKVGPRQTVVVQLSPPENCRTGGLKDPFVEDQGADMLLLAGGLSAGVAAAVLIANQKPASP